MGEVVCCERCWTVRTSSVHFCFAPNLRVSAKFSLSCGQQGWDRACCLAMLLGAHRARHRGVVRTPCRPWSAEGLQAEDHCVAQWL